MAEKETKTNSNKTTRKGLLFDRRYGWVIDEWKPPSDEVLSGGRGMFCILPLAKGLIQTASYSFVGQALVTATESIGNVLCVTDGSIFQEVDDMNTMTNSAIQILERRDELSLQNFQANAGNQLYQLGACVSKPVVKIAQFQE